MQRFQNGNLWLALPAFLPAPESLQALPEPLAFPPAPQVSLPESQRSEPEQSED